MTKRPIKSFVRAANVQAGSTGKVSMGGIEAHAKRLDKTSLLRRVREADPLSWSKVGESIDAGGCDIWDAFKAHKSATGAVERGGASIALHALVGVSREWLEEDGRDPHSAQNDRIQKLFAEAAEWAESWAGKGSVIHSRFDLDEMGTGVVDLVIVPTRMQKRKTRKKAATREVLTISTRMAKEELREAMSAKTSGQAMQSSWNTWCKEKLDTRIERGKSVNETRRPHIHADVLRSEGDRQRAEHHAAMERLRAEKHQAQVTARLDAEKAAEGLFLWARSATGPYHGLLLEDLSEEEENAYRLHRMVVDQYRHALSSENEGHLFPNQSALLTSARKKEPAPEECAARALIDELGDKHIDLSAVQRISELIRQFLKQLVDTIEGHLLTYWSSVDGAHKWDVSTARVCLGSDALLHLEAVVEVEAEELRAAEPAFRNLSGRQPNLAK